MPNPKRTLRVLIPIALLVLLIGSTLGAVWHHHANTSSDACVLCHLVIAGLVSRLFLGFFVNPVLYEMVAREGNVLKV